MLASVVIRTFNEETYLDELLQAIANQDCSFCGVEVVIVDSGSTDRTLAIANQYNCLTTTISQSEFSFGRSLNIGCDVANGDYLVFVSGHCIPADNQWLEQLIAPLYEQKVAYTYGRQVGRDTTKFSEACYFEKTFPEYSKIPQEGYFCNNANAAITREAWSRFKFDEELTGLEDMYLGQQLTASGEQIGYVADARAFHIHDESWGQVKIRYEREAYALHRIMPGLHFGLRDFFRFFCAGLLSDSSAAIRKQSFLKEFPNIVMFRLMHYWGTYKGNHQVRQLSAELKYKYFYPKDVESELYRE